MTVMKKYILFKMPIDYGTKLYFDLYSILLNINFKFMLKKIIERSKHRLND